MSAGIANFRSPADEHERQIGARRVVAERQVGFLAACWVAVQVVAATEFAASVVVLWRIELDSLVTVGMLWAASVPCAAGAAVFAFGNWTVLPRREIVIGLAPWVAILAEMTAAIAWFAL
ncbi:MAG: hypothetical protein WBC44_22315 [Planctomycetaceae bacterium]